MPFCTNCGAQLNGGKFCAECGAPANATDATETSPAPPIQTEQPVQTYPSAPVGTYKGNLCEVVVDSESITIIKRNVIKQYRTRIPFNTIRQVTFNQTKAFSSGYVSIVTDDNYLNPPVTSFNASSDLYSFDFLSAQITAFHKVYEFLSSVARPVPIQEPITTAYQSKPSNQNENSPEPSNSYQVPEHFDTQVQEEPSSIELSDAEIREILAACGSRIETIKQVKDLTGAGLAEAKFMVDKACPLTPQRAKAPSKKERIKENKANAVACCPKCGSTSLSANKKGFGIGKAVVGAALTGGIGLVAGNMGAKKVWVTCLNCGHRWKL